MKRTIKFRGQSVKNCHSINSDKPLCKIGQWLYGDLDTLSTPSPRIRFKDKNGDIISMEVNPETIGQFTGLHDKDGNEIYEGDILSFRINGKIVKNQVGWIDSIAAFDFVKSKTPSFFNELYAKKSIIIGNIHDSPELLKGDKQ